MAATDMTLRPPVSSGSANSKLTSRQSSQAQAIRCRFGGAEQFLLTFNPGGQHRWAALDNLCGHAATPKLFEVRWAYGDAVAKVWLMAQLSNLNEFASQREKMSSAMMGEVAHTVISGYGYLTVGEVMLFFQKFKAGEYGHFYGSIDPLKITSALHSFIVWRREEVEAREAEVVRKRRMEESCRTVTFAEYCRSRGLPAATSIEAMVSAKMTGIINKK